MKHWILLVLMLFFGAAAAQAATITSTASGNLSAGGTWIGGVAPNCTNDDIVVSAGHTVTVDISCTLGPASTNTTNAIQCGGTANTATSLVINAPVVIRGRVQIRRNCTLSISTVGSNTGSWTWFPAATRTYNMEFPNTNTGTPGITITGEAGDLVLVTTNISASTNRGYFDMTTVPPTVNWDYVDVRECGGTGDTTSTRCLSYSAAAASSFTINHSRFSSNVGKIFHTAIGLNDFTFDLQNSDFRSPRHGDWLEIRSDTAATSGNRRIQGNTFHHTSNESIVGLGPTGFTISGNIFSNVSISFDSFDDSNTITGNAFFVDTANGTFFSSRGETDTIIEENIFYTCKDNAHYVSVGAPADSGAATIVRLNIVDGGGSCAVITDDGDFVLPQSDVTIERNILINKAGTLFTAGQPDPDGAGANTNQITARRNTLSDAGKGATVGETNGHALQVVRFSSNLIANMTAGLVQDTAFVQQTSLNIDYNGAYNMSTAGNFDIGVNNGYLGAASIAAWRSGTYASTNDYGLHDIYGDPGFVDSARTLVSWYNSIAGSGGSFSNVRAEMLKLNGTDSSGSASSFNSSYSITAAKTYLRAGFTPTSSSYDGTGDPDDGTTVDVGAVDFTVSAGGTKNLMLFGVGGDEIDYLSIPPPVAWREEEDKLCVRS